MRPNEAERGGQCLLAHSPTSRFYGLSCFALRLPSGTVATLGRRTSIVSPRIHACLQAPSKKEDMAKELSTKDRRKLNRNSFALPGKRKYPIPDKAHARNALARVAQHGTLTEDVERRRRTQPRPLPRAGRSVERGAMGLSPPLIHPDSPWGPQKLRRTPSAHPSRSMPARERRQSRGIKWGCGRLVMLSAALSQARANGLGAGAVWVDQGRGSVRDATRWRRRDGHELVALERAGVTFSRASLQERKASTTKTKTTAPSARGPSPPDQDP